MFTGSRLKLTNTLDAAKLLAITAQSATTPHDGVRTV
jgi:hypothetical protein